ncbi:MAG: helix-turn-helix domain-containing protein [Opitutaceae bacterium]
MDSFDPSRRDFAPYGFTCVRWRPSQMPRPDHHNEVELNLLPRGWVTYLFGGQKVRVAAGRLTVFWAAIPHQVVDHGPQSEYFVATLPLTWFLQCQLPPRLVQPLLQGAVLTEPKKRHAPLDSGLFARWVEELQTTAPESQRAVMLEIEARLLRLARDLSKSTVVTTPRKHALGLGALSRVERMACFVAQHYREKLSVERIASVAGLHPNYAMSLFQRIFGATLVGHLTQHRVSHAQRLLATTDDKIVDVALASGFSSISRFNEAFRAACGCSPREYRHRFQAMP